MPQNYRKINTIWYRFRIEDDNGDTTGSTNNVDLLSNPFTECSHSINSMHDSPDNDFTPFGNTHTISYFGIRIPVTNVYSNIDVASFKESFVINRPEGNLTGIAVYEDSGNTEATTANRTDWIITGGTGIYKKANFAQIIYDNEGLTFGTTYSRKIRIFECTDEY